MLAGLRGELGRRERLHGQRVDLGAHPVAERRVDALVAAHAQQPVELGGETMVAKKMAPVALDGNAGPQRIPAAM